MLNSFQHLYYVRKVRLHIKSIPQTTHRFHAAFRGSLIPLGAPPCSALASGNHSTLCYLVKNWEMGIDTWDANNLSIATISGTRFLDLYSKNPELIEFKKVSLEQKTHIKTHCLYEISKKKNFKDAKWFIRFDCEGNDLILEWEYHQYTEQLKNYTIYENIQENKSYLARQYKLPPMKFLEPADIYKLPGDTTPIAQVPQESTFTYLAVTDEAEPISIIGSSLVHWYLVHLDSLNINAWIHTDRVTGIEVDFVGFIPHHYIGNEILRIFYNPI